MYERGVPYLFIMKNCGRAETRHREGWRVTRKGSYMETPAYAKLNGTGCCALGKEKDDNKCLAEFRGTFFVRL